MGNPRPIRALAKELKISERQFHRRLDKGDHAAVDLLRADLAEVYRSNLQNTALGMVDVADLLKRTDRKLSDALRKVAAAVRRIHDIPVSEFRQEHGARLMHLAGVDDLSDEAYNAYEADLDDLPPTVDEWLAENDDDTLADLEV